MRSRLKACTLTSAAIGLCTLAGCARRANSNPVFITVNDHGRVAARLDTYVYAPAVAGRRPVVILSHGSAAFQDAGGNVQFHLLTGVDGHGLRAHPDSWRPIVDSFLAAHD